MTSISDLKDNFIIWAIIEHAMGVKNVAIQITIVHSTEHTYSIEEIKNSVGEVDKIIEKLKRIV